MTVRRAWMEPSIPGGNAQWRWESKNRRGWFVVYCHCCNVDTGYSAIGYDTERLLEEARLNLAAHAWACCGPDLAQSDGCFRRLVVRFFGFGNTPVPLPEIAEYWPAADKLEAALKPWFGEVAKGNVDRPQYDAVLQAIEFLGYEMSFYEP